MVKVSLWGGEVVFSNLDLRLGVLEEEFQLPFSFVNGHIHELRIQVPWTRLATEPIVVTVNTLGETTTAAVNRHQTANRINACFQNAF